MNKEIGKLEGMFYKLLPSVDDVGIGQHDIAIECAKLCREQNKELRENIEIIIEKVCKMHPYKMIGKPETYSQYNEAWEDACDVVEQELIEFLNQQDNDT